MKKDFQKQASEFIQKGFFDLWLVMDGDWEGQIYLTVPWWKLGENACISDLLKALDSLAWVCNEGEGATAYVVSPSYYEFDYRNGVPGGMGGGELSTEGIWIHEEFSEKKFVIKKLLDMSIIE